MKNFYAYSSQFRENRFPIYVITDQDPLLDRDWENTAYQKKLIGVYNTYSDAYNAILKTEPDFIHYEELDDSFLQGERVFVHK